MTDKEPHNLVDRANVMTAFEKLDVAIQMIEEAMKERPILKDLQLEPLLRTLAAGLHILSTKDSELDLRGLMLKHEWRVGQRFFVRAVVKSAASFSFIVLPRQDVPEGVVIWGKRRNLMLRDGDFVALDLEIQRRVRKVVWRIRTIDRERSSGASPVGC